MTSLAHDRPEIAFPVIKCSPVLTEHDLINLATEGSDMTRAFVAGRPNIPVSVCAAIVEIGHEGDVILLLENTGLAFNATTLIRIMERHGACAQIRGLLWSRDDLPSEARQMLSEQVGKAMASSSLIGNIIGSHRFERVRQEVDHRVILDLAGRVPGPKLADFVDHLRDRGKLAPDFLMQALCAAKADFFVAAVANLANLPEKRVLSIIGDGRYHAIRALYEAAGLSREISGVFVEATLIVRTLPNARDGNAAESIYQHLATLFGSSHGAVGELVELVDRLRLEGKRQHARTYASISALMAA